MLGFGEPSYVFRDKNVLAQHQNARARDPTAYQTANSETAVTIGSLGFLSRADYACPPGSG